MAATRAPPAENAHATVRPAAWWQALFADIGAKFPEVRYAVSMDEPRVRHDGKRDIQSTMVEG